MDNILCNNIKLNKNEESGETSRVYLEDEKCNNELLKISNNSSGWWPNDNEGEKNGSRQRWSFGSDISIEAVENMQNRLCCSPVDEYDSNVSSENEDLIVNNTEDTDEPYKNYIPVSPASSPTFKKIIYNEKDKKQNKNQDVDTADDELIDYSKRYTTDSFMSVENKQVGSSQIQQRQRRNVDMNTVSSNVPQKKSSVNNRSKVDPFRDYAETDLDQPTDYSLRYAEEDTDDEEKENTRFYCTNEQEDTIKTYHTEGTPYQTPCNFSTATSMSDLLILEDTREGDEVINKRQFLRQKQETVEKSEKAVKISKNQVRRKYILEDPKIPVVEEERKLNDRKPRVRKIEKLLTPPQSPAEPCDRDKENRVVTFNVEDTYAQETPLMFSRCSSLDSLSEFDQHSIHDDHSSVISDFSHRTSGAVSPSDLPDSPTQTVPPSPQRLKQQTSQNQQQQQQEHQKQQCQQQNQQPHLQYQQQPQCQQYQQQQKPHYQEQEQQQVERLPLRTVPRRPECHQGSNNKVQQIMQNSTPCREPILNQLPEQGSVFEDGLVSFKEESMSSRVNSTRASSLSALTIDDDDDCDECDNREIMNRIAAIRVRTSAAGMHQAPMYRQNRNDPYQEADKLSRQSQPNKVLNRHPDYRNNCPMMTQSQDAHYMNVESQNHNYPPAYADKRLQGIRSKSPPKNHSYDDELINEYRNQSNRAPARSPVSTHNSDTYSPHKIEYEEIMPSDSVRIYCTENTPTFVSPYGSQSNLSALSMISMSDENLAYSINYRDDIVNEDGSDNDDEDLEPRTFYEKEGSESRVDAYGTDASSDFSEDDGEGCDDRRIDVSPFDSQLNLTSFSLLCIKEESEEEDEEEMQSKREEVGEEETNNETDKSDSRENSCAEDENAYKRLSDENGDDSDDDNVLAECIKSGVSKFTRRREHSNVNEQSDAPSRR